MARQKNIIFVFMCSTVRIAMCLCSEWENNFTDILISFRSLTTCKYTDGLLLNSIAWNFLPDQVHVYVHAM